MADKNTKVERRVANTILNKPIEVNVGGKIYTAEQPTLATLLEVSALVAQLPEGFGKDPSVSGVMRDILSCARDVAHICAVYICGVKKPSLLQGVTHKKIVAAVTDEILYGCTNSEIALIFTEFIEVSNLKDFFSVSTFLGGLNLTKPTKVETGTIASGQL